MIDFATVKSAARGRWPEIWDAIGVPGRIPPPGRHGPCPGCGGRDRFRLLPDDEDGRWVCGQGGDPTGGDGFSLLIHCGIASSPSEALRRVADQLGLSAKADPQARQMAREAAQRREREQLEAALAHELRVLLIVLDNRLAGRELERNRRFREARPEWQPLPGAHWQRETLAAQRVAALLGRLYPKQKRRAA